MDLSSLSLEDILDSAAHSTPQLTLWLAGQSLTATRLVSWNRHSGVLVCRGGNGFTDEDIHYLRISHVHGLTLRAPAPRQESDRLGPEVRDALRQAAGYPVSLVLRPNAFPGADAPLAAWLKNVVEAISLLEPLRDPLQASVEQILLREGDSIAVLGGSTLILEASPLRIPSPLEIRNAIAPLL